MTTTLQEKLNEIILNVDLSERDSERLEKDILDLMAEQKRLILEEVNESEVLQNQRYMSKSGFWTSRELIDKGELCKRLSKLKM